MDKETKEKLKKAGWVVGSVKEFLNLSEEDIKLIEIRIALGIFLKEQREKCGYTQTQLAKEMRSSQSRIAKMENGDNNVTIDIILKSLLHLKTPVNKIYERMAKV